MVGNIFTLRSTLQIFMKAIKLFTLVLSVLPALLFVSCSSNDDKKQDPKPVPAVVKCLVTGYANPDSSIWVKYQYDALGRLDSMTEKNSNSFYYLSFNHDSNNKRINQTQSHNSNSNVFFTTYTYNSQGRLTKISLQSKLNGVFVPNRTYTYTYDPAGILLRKDTENNLSGLPSTYTLYVFNTGKVAASTYTNANVLSMVEEYEFDSNKPSHKDVTGAFFGEFNIPHNIIKYNQKDASGNVQPRYSYSNVYQFNADGYPIQRTQTTVDGIVTVENYTYSCN